MKTTTWDLAQAKGALPTLSHLLLPAPDEAGSADRYVSGGLGRGSNLPNITQQESGRAGLHPSKCLHIPPSLQPLGQQDPALAAPILRLHSSTSGSSHMLFPPQNSVPSPLTSHLTCQLSASVVPPHRGLRDTVTYECLSPSLPTSCLLDPFLALGTKL